MPSDDAWRVVDEGWGRRAVDFATLSEPANCREYVSLHSHLQISPTDRVLDVACGAGLAVELAAARSAVRSHGQRHPTRVPHVPSAVTFRFSPSPSSSPSGSRYPPSMTRSAHDQIGRDRPQGLQLATPHSLSSCSIASAIAFEASVRELSATRCVALLGSARQSGVLRGARCSATTLPGHSSATTSDRSPTRGSLVRQGSAT